MSKTISQDILNALTDVDMPKLVTEPTMTSLVIVQGHHIPVYACGTIVMGSGAAGLRAAVELKRRGTDVAIISQSAWGGTSACSGSDKQTLHTANTSDLGDNFKAMARAIRAGGAMDEDTAYVEAVGSVRAMASIASNVRPSSALKGPDQMRRNSRTWAWQPSASPKSRAMDRT